MPLGNEKFSAAGDEVLGSRSGDTIFCEAVLGGGLSWAAVAADGPAHTDNAAHIKIKINRTLQTILHYAATWLKMGHQLGHLLGHLLGYGRDQTQSPNLVKRAMKNPSMPP